jgi:feruloyl esterase
MEMFWSKLRRSIGPIAALVMVFGLRQAAAAADDRCAELINTALDQAQVVSAAQHSAGSFKPPEGSAFEVPRPFCRVVIVARPAAGSEIGIELWLPDAAQWTGRFWGLGNGSFGGQIFHRGLGARVAAGYAAVATDTGHRADPGDSSWALGQPGKIIDYGHRSVHLAAVHGKAVAAAYYGRKPRHAYFSGYSNGGRQALMLAQRYPDDYDGIVAGAPAPDLTAIYVNAAEFQAHLLNEPAARVSASQLAALSSAVMNACDAQDGVRDGVLENPLTCSFDPAVLACTANASPECLTPAQLGGVRRLYGGIRSAPGGPPISPLAPGSEPTWHALHFGDKPGSAVLLPPTEGFFRHLVAGDAAWDIARFRMHSEGQAALRQLPATLDAADPGITRFVARGGKLILWQGWNDAITPPKMTVDYHARVLLALGAEQAARSVRLFMAPGVEHGVGGPGADRFGQFASGDGDPARSLGAAMRRWVEQGEAPEQVVAVRHRVPQNPGTEVVRSRPLCAWPRVAVHSGQGSTDDARNFSCAEPAPAVRR